MAVKVKPRREVIDDTKCCPGCGTWIVCTPGQRDELDYHIIIEHPDVFDRQIEARANLLGLSENEVQEWRDYAMAVKTPTKPVVKDSEETKAPKAVKSQECWCGCEGLTKGGKFLPGHDAKAKSALTEAIEANPGKRIAQLPGIDPRIKAEAETIFNGRYAEYA